MSILADNLWAYFKTNSIVSTGERTATASDRVTINDIPQGYYLVFGEALSEENKTFTAAPALVNATPTARITLKMATPTIERQVWDHHSDSWADTTSANIREQLDFKLTTVVPDMTGYSSYMFKIQEQFTGGLVRDTGVPVSVKIGGVIVHQSGFTYGIVIMY